MFFFSNLKRFVISAGATTLSVLAGIGKDFSSIALLSLGLCIGSILTVKDIFLVITLPFFNS